MYIHLYSLLNLRVTALLSMHTQLYLLDKHYTGVHPAEKVFNAGTICTSFIIEDRPIGNRMVKRL